MIDPAQRFSSRVDNYIRYRPSYPAAIVDTLERECRLTPEWVIADVGAGPGNLTRLFLDNGARVVGVEPNREMREAGERLLRGYPTYTAIAATAEATTLADTSVDLVTAGQAFHWFDQTRARQEFARILRAPRWVALVWNERRAFPCRLRAASTGVRDRLRPGRASRRGGRRGAGTLFRAQRIRARNLREQADVRL